MANNNNSENIRLKFEFPKTHLILYNGEKFPINFDLFKFSSKYFYELRHEISECSDINLESYDPDDNMSQFPPEEVGQFIKYIQFQTIQLTNENVATLHYFGHKYKIEQLILSTEKYINNHEDEICLKFLKRKELHRIIDSNYYENKIASNFIKYVNNEDILNLDITTLHRILEKASKMNEDRRFESAKNDFLMKVLSKYGRSASILFKYTDIDTFDDELLTILMTKYSDNFEFEYITSSVLNAFLKMKKSLEKERQEHLKFQEEAKDKYRRIEQVLQEQIKNNEEMGKLLEKERKEHLKYQEESKNKFTKIEQNLQEQIKRNEKMMNLLEKERKEYLKYQEESKNKYAKIEQDLQEQIKNNDEMKKLLEKKSKEFFDGNDISKTGNENKINDTQNSNVIELSKIIDIDSPCFDPSDLIKRTLIVYNTEFKITCNDKPINELCDKLQNFIDEHSNDFKKSVTMITARALFDEEITVYKKAFVFAGKTWNEIRAEIKKYSLRKMTKELVIFAIGSMIQQNCSSQTEPRFNLCFVTRSITLPLICTSLPKTCPSLELNPNQTQASENPEFEITSILQSIASKNKSLQINAEISAIIKQELISRRGKNWKNNEIKEMVSNEIEYPWIRFYFNFRYDELIKKVITEYKYLFSKKIEFANVLVVSVINEDISTNTFSATVITGQVKTNNNSSNNIMHLPKEIKPVSSLVDIKGSASTNENGCAKSKVINEFDGSHLFLKIINNYRQNLNRGLPILEFNDTLIDSAIDLSRTIMQNFTVVNFRPFIDAAKKNSEIENIEVCATFESKTNGYVSRAFEAMLKKFQREIESDNDKIAIGFWDDKDENVSASCFLYRFKKQK